MKHDTVTTTKQKPFHLVIPHHLISSDESQAVKHLIRDFRIRFSAHPLLSTSPNRSRWFLKHGMIIKRLLIVCE